MTDETEALRKRIEEMEREVNDLLIALWSRPITPAHPDYYMPYPAVEHWKPDFFGENSPYRGCRVYKDLPTHKSA